MRSSSAGPPKTSTGRGDEENKLPENPYDIKGLGRAS